MIPEPARPDEPSDHVVDEVLAGVCAWVGWLVGACVCSRVGRRGTGVAWGVVADFALHASNVARAAVKHAAAAALMAASA
jgi:hypothetical protein